MQPQAPNSVESLDADIAPALNTLDDVTAALTHIEAEHRNKAQRTLDAYRKTRDADIDEWFKSSITEAAAKLQATRTRRFSVVAQMLDADSLPWFLELIEAEHQSELRSEYGSKGSTAKHKKTAALKAWALNQAATMRVSDKQIAKKLFAVLPADLATASGDAERLIYDTLRASRKKK